MAEARERPCQVCAHPDVASINQALINGRSQRSIARDFGFGSRRGTPEFIPDNKIVSRHVDRCMASAYQHAKANREEATGAAMLDRLHFLDTVVDEQLARLREGKVIMRDGVPLLNDDGTPMKAFSEADLRGTVREARRNLELRSRLAGANPEGDPDAAEHARQLLLSPEARAAITELEGYLAEQANS